MPEHPYTRDMDDGAEPVPVVVRFPIGIDVGAPQPKPNGYLNGHDGIVVTALPPKYSDDGLALRFTERHAANARYVALWGKWLWWRGTHWQTDETLEAFNAARIICREAAREMKGDDALRKGAVTSAKAVAAIVTLARADRHHAATADQWDADPWTLGAQSVTVDLRAGAVRAPAREDYLTKRCATDPGSDCPRWLRFLAEITAGDDGLQGYLRRLAGYCLTGNTSEHALFFCHGTGANGKSVFINTLAGIWGDYAQTAPMDTFCATTTDRHPTDLAGLRGARLVVAQETQQGRRWDEAKIKALTGGDRVSARFMRQDFFTFVPQFKLLIAGNHRPEIRNVDEAMRRRIHLVPFSVTIPPPARDHTLAEKLRVKWPGILRWAIDGCQEWQRIGLAPPAAVRAATEDYLSTEDAVGNWLAECTERSSGHTELRALFASWSRWCQRTGEHIGTEKRLSQALRDRGLEKCLVGKANLTGFRGLTLREEPSGDGPYWTR